MAEAVIDSLDSRLRKLIENACVAFERSNFAYVVDATTEVLRVVPGYLPARRLQRIAQRRIHGVGRQRFLRRVTELLTFWHGRPGPASGEPSQLLTYAESRLAIDPESTAALRLLAEAAKGMALPETRVFAFEEIRKLEPGNRANLLALGGALLEAARPAEALRLAEAMLAEWPGDSEAMELMRASSVAQTVAQPGWQIPANGHSRTFLTTVK